MNNYVSVLVKTTELASGLRIVTVSLPHLHTAAIAAFVKVGSRFESPEENGLSHFVEHMLFRGTAAYPSSLDLNFAIESVGATLYAETGRDLSLFHIALEPALLDAGLALFGELFLRPRFGDIELERALILEEMVEDYDDSGVEINGDDIARGLIFGDHPLAQRVIGPSANVQRFTEAEVQRHFARHYCAKNMLLCVAGPVQADAVVASAERYLSALPPGAEVPVVSPQFEQSEARYRYVRDRGAQTSVNIVFRGIGDLDPDYVTSLALLRAIDDGMSTPLHYQICDQKGLAYSIGAGIEPLADVALLEIASQTSGAKVPALIRSVLELLSRFREQPISEAELVKIKRRYRYDLLAAVDDSYAMANWFGGTRLYYAPPELAQRIAEMDQVTAESVQAVAKRIFTPARLAVAVVGNLSAARQGEIRDIVQSWR